jgi:hypothetical protein
LDHESSALGSLHDGNGVRCFHGKFRGRNMNRRRCNDLSLPRQNDFFELVRSAGRTESSSWVDYL